MCRPLQGVLLDDLVLSLGQAGAKEWFCYYYHYYSGTFAKRKTSLCLGGNKEKDKRLALSLA